MSAPFDQEKVVPNERTFKGENIVQNIGANFIQNGRTFLK